MGIEYSTLLSSVNGIIHGFGVGPSSLDVHLKSCGIQNYRSFETDQLHGKLVHVLDKSPVSSVLEGDAFITNRPGIICHVRTADCVPILIADKKKRAIAAVHAGWRGTSLDVVGKAIEEMKRNFGTDPFDCIVAIGPSICGNCYEVGGEVVKAIEGLDIDDEWKNGEGLIDLGAANRLLLRRAGVPNNNIDEIAQCTCCDERFISWRRDKNNDKRQVNFITVLQP